MSSVERRQMPNERLAALMAGLNVNKKGLANRMREASRADGGEAVSPTHTTIARYLSGEYSQPKPRSVEVMAAALSQKAGRPVTAEEIGYQPSQSDPSQAWTRWAERQLVEQMNRQLRELGITRSPEVPAERKPIPGHAFAGLVNGHDREGWER